MSKLIRGVDIFLSAIYDDIEKISLRTALLTSGDMAEIANLLVKYGFLKYPEDDEEDKDE